MKLKFQAKVLLPVVTVLVIFVAATLWLFSTRVEKQLRSDARLQRARFQDLFTRSLQLRTNNLAPTVMSRIAAQDFYDLPFELAKRIARPAKQPTEDDFRAFRNSMLAPLRQLLESVGDPHEDAIALITLNGGQLADYSTTPALVGDRFQTAAGASIEAVFNSQTPDVRTIEYENRLLNIVSVPFHGPTTDDRIGVVTVGKEIGHAFASESKLKDSEVAIIVNNHVAASTFGKPDLDDSLLHIFGQLSNPDAPEFYVVNGSHYVGLAGDFRPITSAGSAGYLLLTSYEKPLAEFHDTEQVLLLGSLLGIILGTTAVWLLVRRATRPLIQLRDTAEAVGRGDFSKRINIASGDELGELAAVFNQMTENLEKSLVQLEKTVEILRNTQAQLIHSEKLSAVGEFVAGIAHELNNPLTALIGYSELLQMGNVDDSSRDSLKRISNSAERCHKIVQSLLSFARQHPPERKLTNIHNVVDAVLEILIYELRTSNISVTKEYAPNMPRLMVDPHQLQQVFLNIVNNARQAIEAHQAKGAIRIVTRAAGSRIQVRFEDNGPGISAENLAKIFNPFFTTKPVGKGTGLGLSLSYGIVQEHGGAITAESKIGHGTTFIIELRVTSGSETAAEVAAPPPPSPVDGVGRKVLVVDDEPDILDVVHRLLAKQGYEVQTASDGENALACIGNRSFDLIISDWKMPGMNGRQLYERLLETNKIAANNMIFMTGDVLSEKVEKYLTDHGKTCLTKPFSQVEFRTAITRVFEKK